MRIFTSKAREDTGLYSNTSSDSLSLLIQFTDSPDRESEDVLILRMVFLEVGIVLTQWNKSQRWWNFTPTVCLHVDVAIDSHLSIRGRLVRLSSCFPPRQEKRAGAKALSPNGNPVDVDSLVLYIDSTVASCTLHTHTLFPFPPSFSILPNQLHSTSQKLEAPSWNFGSTSKVKFQDPPTRTILTRFLDRKSLQPEEHEPVYSSPKREE